MSFMHLSPDHPLVSVRSTATDQIGPLAARYVMDGRDSEGRFGLVEHPVAPRGLAAPLHRHTREDEYSFVLEGRWGFQLRDEVLYAEPGDLVFKPRDVWHTFWNASDAPARLLEIVSPAGFEHYFEELAALLRSHGMERPELLGALAARYGLEMDLASVEGLLRTHGLVMDPAAEGAR